MDITWEEVRPGGTRFFGTTGRPWFSELHIYIYKSFRGPMKEFPAFSGGGRT